MSIYFNMTITPSRHGKNKELSRVILLTPNERLSEQHLAELQESNIPAIKLVSIRKVFISGC